MARPTNYQYKTDPLVFAKILWPEVRFYSKQRDILYSLVRDDETVVPAAQMMGKDFVAGFAVLWFFLTRKPCRVITTSAKDEHLVVLWGEINNFINTAKYPLRSTEGGPLLVNDKLLRKVDTFTQEMCAKSYVKGMVANEQSMAAMGGHHIADVGDGIPRTMLVADESSSVPTAYVDTADGWARRKFLFGNTWPCDNFFKWAVEGKPGEDDKGGDLPRDPNDLSKGYHRKVIHISAEDSPNVRWAKAQEAQGKDPDTPMPAEVRVPGVLPWDEYKRRRKVWPKDKQTVGLDARWLKGQGVLLFPDEWMDISERVANILELHRRGAQLTEEQLQTFGLPVVLPRRRRTKGIGIDPAEGGDSSDLTACDEYGVTDWESAKTPKPSEMFKMALAFIRKHKMDNAEMGEHVCIDRGGGLWLADKLRDMGIPVRTVAFGESVMSDPKLATLTPHADKMSEREDKYTYVNRRAFLYGTLSERMDPNAGHPWVWAIPRRFGEFRKQLTPIPRGWDDEGRVKLPPKRKKGPNDKTITLIDLIGHSPDAADSLVLAYYAMTDDVNRPQVGAMYDVKATGRTGGNEVEIGGIDVYD